MYVVCAVAMGSMAAINAGAFLLARRARREARARLEALSDQATEVHLPTAQPTGYLIPQRTDTRTTIDTSIKDAAAAPVMREMSRVSRRSLQLIAGKAMLGTEATQATQLLSLYEAERELRVVSVLTPRCLSDGR